MARVGDLLAISELRLEGQNRERAGMGMQVVFAVRPSKDTPISESRLTHVLHGLGRTRLGFRIHARLSVRDQQAL
ncbi:hypothetical protein CU102_08395 [Phyllobacterium brassicacearum]|uniref:Uncharacterized protein n=1 Tax=Phyllobacterium brassicacearum TaxID=314235 RepID=A0A2P7BSF1_9HYPH|nr:hypothetical protein CU102_08395 [Phyllobacterium brassicacearum]TDQ34434.1 hypothetical protein DEV91_103166 [Phyllobacterium brassicacearum]